MTLDRTLISESEVKEMRQKTWKAGSSMQRWIQSRLRGKEKLGKHDDGYNRIVKVEHSLRSNAVQNGDGFSG